MRRRRLTGRICDTMAVVTGGLLPSHWCPFLQVLSWKYSLKTRQPPGLQHHRLDTDRQISCKLQLQFVYLCWHYDYDNDMLNVKTENYYSACWLAGQVSQWYFFMPVKVKIRMWGEERGMVNKTLNTTITTTAGMCQWNNSIAVGGGWARPSNLLNV